MPELKTEWVLSPLFESATDPKIEKTILKSKAVYKKFSNNWKDRVDYLENPEVLKEALDEFEQLASQWDGTGSAGYYFFLKNRLDQSDADIKSKNNKITEIEVSLANEVEFFTNRLGKVPAKKQHEFTNSQLLAPYRHFLEKLFVSAKYTLTESEEKILNLTNQSAFSSWVKMVSEFVSREEREILLENGKREIKPMYEIMKFLSSQDKKVRDNSAQAFNDILTKTIDVAEHEINAVLQTKKVDDELRGISRPDLLRHVLEDIDTEVVDSLVKAVSDCFDISKRYYALKAKMMGVKKLKYHERNVPLYKQDTDLEYKEAVKLVSSTLGSLDPDFERIFKDIVSGGQIDVFPRKNKSGGAFCVSKRFCDPIYILMNYSNKLDGALTLAHEVGHAIHATLTLKNQNGLNSGNPLSTAEVSSTFMEDFVFSQIKKDEKDAAFILMDRINEDISAIFRQIAFYKFEQELHKTYRNNGYLTKEKIGGIFQKHMKSYMGTGVEQSPGSQNWWIYVGHFRRFFYVYSYASGLLISKSLQGMVKKDPKNIELMKRFLSVGSSMPPKEVFMGMGIDITKKDFWQSGLNEINNNLKEVERLVS